VLTSSIENTAVAFGTLDATNRGRTWTASGRTGEPLAEPLDQLRQLIPGLIVERLQVTHPADDDNVYFIGDQKRLDRIQLDTAPLLAKNTNAR